MSSHELHTHGSDSHEDHGHGHGDTPHVLPLKVYYGVWGALMILTAITISAAYVPIEALHVPLAVGIATIKATLVALFFMHLLYDEKYNLVLLISAMGVVVIFLTFTIGDPLTRGMVNPISFKPIVPEMTTTTLTRPQKMARAAEHGTHAPAPLGPSGTPHVPAPAVVGPAAENAHPGADKPQGQTPPR